MVDVHGRMLTFIDKKPQKHQLYNAAIVKPFYKETGILHAIKSLCSNDDKSITKAVPAFQIHLKEIFKHCDPRAWKFSDVIQKEIDGLIKKVTFKLVYKDEIEPDATIL